MLEIHQFWVQLLPIFNESYQFVYIFFDISSVIFIIDMLITIPKLLFLKGKEL